MITTFTRWLVPAAALCTALLTQIQAQAQTQAQTQANSAPAATPRSDPQDARARVPALVYESSFARYRRALEDKPISWREANDNVTRIGGWRTYAREASSPEPAASMPSAHGAHKTP